MRSVSQLVKNYNSNLAENEELELIQVSLDKSEAASLAWAKKEKFPWHIIPMKNLKSTKMDKYKVRGVPSYILVDGDGKVISNDRTKVMNMIKGQ